MRFTGSAPVVVPGPAGIERAERPNCDACETDADPTRTLHVVGPDLAVVLCRNAAACARRYRRGVSPETFAAGLRGELLAVAP